MLKSRHRTLNFNLNLRDLSVYQLIAEILFFSTFCFKIIRLDKQEMTNCGSDWKFLNSKYFNLISYKYYDMRQVTIRLI